MSSIILVSFCIMPIRYLWVCATKNIGLFFRMTSPWNSSGIGYPSRLISVGAKSIWLILSSTIVWLVPGTYSIVGTISSSSYILSPCPNIPCRLSRSSPWSDVNRMIVLFEMLFCSVKFMTFPICMSTYLRALSYLFIESSFSNGVSVLSLSGLKCAYSGGYSLGECVACRFK